MSSANRIASAFDGKKGFVAFITGGDPDIDTTVELIFGLAEAGADLIEIGIPFSDPIAEGEVIQRADERALKSGCTTDKLFAAVKKIRERLREIPLVFMTYINPVYVYGAERFMANCADCGIDGIIVPDMPFEERGELADVCAKHGICLISMIAPTSEGRIEAIAKQAEGFLYCVSSLGVTGVRSRFDADIAGMIERVKRVSTIPCAVGFGVSTPEQARDMAAISDGVIVGSAIVRLVERYGKDSAEPVKEYVREMRSLLA